MGRLGVPARFRCPLTPHRDRADSPGLPGTLHNPRDEAQLPPERQAVTQDTPRFRLRWACTPSARAARGCLVHLCPPEPTCAHLPVSGSRTGSAPPTPAAHVPSGGRGVPRVLCVAPSLPCGGIRGGTPGLCSARGSPWFGSGVHYSPECLGELGSRGQEMGALVPASLFCRPDTENQQRAQWLCASAGGTGLAGRVVGGCERGLGGCSHSPHPRWLESFRGRGLGGVRLLESCAFPR